MAIDYSKAKYKNTAFGGTEGITLPIGTTAERGTTTAQLRYNSDTGLSEINAASGWQPIDAPPVVTTISPTSFDGSSGTVITVNGSNFKASSTVKFITANGTELNAGTVTFVSSAQLTATIPRNILVSEEPLDVKVVNPSGLSAVLEDSLDAGNGPTFSTGAGTLATIGDEYGSYTPIATVSASDPDGGGVTLNVTSGSVPAGTTFNTGNGQISGNPTNVGSTTTSNFTVEATDSVGNTATRSFSIIVNPVQDGTSSARAASSALAIKTNVLAAGGTQSDVEALTGARYITNSSGTQQIYCIMDYTWDGGGWMIIANNSASGTIYNSGHIPRPTSYSPYVGNNGSNSYSPGTNFSVNCLGFNISKFVQVIQNNNSSFALSNMVGYNSWTVTSPFQIPNQSTWAVLDGDRTMSINPVISGMGNYRAYYTSYGVTTPYSSGYGIGVFGQGTSTTTSIGGIATGAYGSGGSYYPVYLGCWGTSSNYAVGCFSWSDYSTDSSPTGLYQGVGFDDWQDGSGMGDNWTIETSGKLRAKPSYIMIKE